MSKTKAQCLPIAALVAALTASGCEIEPTDDFAERAPAIVEYAEPGDAEFETSTVTLFDGDRPVKVDVWHPVARQGIEPQMVIASAARGLVLISHGSQSKGTLHKFIGEHLASRRYLVLAPNHYGDTLGTPATDTVYLDRIADLKHTLDEAEVRADWRPFFDAGVASTGHSIGGFDALALCGAAVNPSAVAGECSGGNENFCTLGRAQSRWREFSDARVNTCVGMTPFVHPIYGQDGEGAAGLDRPVLLIGAVLDPILLLDPYLRNFYVHTAEGTSLIELEGVGHLDFTDILHDGTLPHNEIKTIVNAYLTAWLEAQLHDDTQATALFTEEAIESGAYGYTVNGGKR